MLRGCPRATTRCRPPRWLPGPRAGFAEWRVCRDEYPCSSTSFRCFSGQFELALAFKRRLPTESRLLDTGLDRPGKGRGKNWMRTAALALGVTLSIPALAQEEALGQKPPTSVHYLQYGVAL